MKNSKISCLYLSQNDLLSAGCFNLKRAIKITEEVLIDFSKERVLFPDKVSQIFDETTQARINCLPATLLEKQVCGMKWVSVFPENPTKHDLQNLSAVILLSETNTGFPIAFMEGTLCSDIRTASVSAVAAKYLANKNPETIGFIGSGNQARMHLIAMKSIFPQLTTCKVASRHIESENKFVDDLSVLFPEVEFIKCSSDYEKSVTETDIIITAISAQIPILQADWIKRGAFYSHVGGWEDDYSVPLKADKIVCDSWEAVKHRTQTISRLYQMKRLDDSNIYADLYEIVSNEKNGRETDEEFIYFNAVGLSYVDVALAYDMYLLAKSQNIGTEMTLQEAKLFDRDVSRFIKV